MGVLEGEPGRKPHRELPVQSRGLGGHRLDRGEGEGAFVRRHSFTLLAWWLIRSACADSLTLLSPSFGSTHYSFSAGYAVLFGLAPDASDVAAAALPEGDAQTASHFQKRIISLMKREKLVTSCVPSHFLPKLAGTGADSPPRSDQVSATS